MAAVAALALCQAVLLAAAQECTSCPAGKQRSDVGAGSGGAPPTCEPCPAQYVSVGGDNCHRCPSGSVPNGEQSGCIECGAGEQVAAAQTACEACPPAQASSRTGVCQLCEVGTVPGPGQSHCERCDTGAEPDSAAIRCVPCLPGQASALAGLCHACGAPPAGPPNARLRSQLVAEGAEPPRGRRIARAGDNMVPNRDRSACEACPAGAEPLANQTACAACAPGGYSTTNGFCHSCERSEYSNAERSARRARAHADSAGRPSWW
jgi:hypothetical protein